MWGSMVWTSYAYVGGLTATNYGRSVARWGRAVPAVKVQDRDLSGKVLAADTVFYTGGPLYLWDAVQPTYLINHRKWKDPTRPAFQNILYGDGHVEGKGSEYYPNALNTTNNFSLQHAKSPIGGFIYWGPKLAGSVAAATTSAAPKPNPAPPPPPAPLPLPIR